MATKHLRLPRFLHGTNENTSPAISGKTKVVAMIMILMLHASSMVVAQDDGGTEEPTTVKTVESLLFPEDIGTNEGTKICPSLEEYEETKKSPVVSAVNSTHILVDWTELWSDMTWRDCISRLELVLDDKEIKAITNVMENTSVLKVDTCYSHKIKVKITLANNVLKHAYSMEVILNPSEESSRKLRSKITEYIPFQQNKAISASYLKSSNLTTNMNCLRIRANSSNLIEEHICNKVSTMELVFRKEGKVEEEGWTVAKEILSLERNDEDYFLLDEVICDLSDYCAIYEFGLRIVETTLSDATSLELVVPLTSVGPVDFTDIKLTEAMKPENLRLDGPDDLMLLYAKHNRIALQWNKNDNDCISGYLIHVKNHEELNKLGAWLFTAPIYIYN